MIANPSAWMTPYGILLMLGLSYLLASTVMTIIGLVNIWSKWTADNTTKIVWTLIDLVLWPIGWIAVAVINNNFKKQAA